MTLANGDQLGYSMIGPSTAKKSVFLLHGNPSSRLEVADWTNVVEELNFRMICIDRPGLGLSTYQADRSLSNWPSQVLEVADHLDIEHIKVAGSSGGGPYALACAHQLPPSRLVNTAIIAGIGEFSLGRFWAASPQQFVSWCLAKYLPSLRAAIVKSSLRPPVQSSDPKVYEAFIDKLITSFSKEAQSMFPPNSLERHTLACTFKEHFSQRLEGHLQEVKVLTSPWPFRMEDIQGDVRLYWGNKDDLAPLSMGEEMAKRIPGAELKVFEGADHFSLTYRHGKEIMEDFLGH